MTRFIGSVLGRLAPFPAIVEPTPYPDTTTETGEEWLGIPQKAVEEYRRGKFTPPHIKRKRVKHKRQQRRK